MMRARPLTHAQHSFNSLIATIVKNRLPVFFFSPHLDDAMLSAGGLIAHVAKKTSVTIVTVFTTGSPPPNAPFAQRCLREAGYTDTGIYFHDRRQEDMTLCQSWGVTCIHLGFTDAAWRKQKSISVYPETVITDSIDSFDARLMSQISGKIGRIIHDHSTSIVFGPLAVGHHVDHLITRAAVLSACSRPILWSDFPYNITNKPDHIFLATHHLHPALWTDNQEEKAGGITAYKTQMKSLFPDGKILLSPDMYFLAQ